MAIIYLALGSNLGDREDNLRRAFLLLQEHQIFVLKTAAIIETDPVGGPPQGKYLNTVAKVETALLPQELLQTIQTIERQLGRVRSVKDGPRTLDIDILLYDNIQITTPELTIPHPRMLEREFVLKPLKEIAPEIVRHLTS